MITFVAHRQRRPRIGLFIDYGSVALLFYTNRILNPALVLVELVINGYVLFINRKSISNIRWRVAPILIGLLIGVGIGSYILSLVHPSWVKFVTYIMLLPWILLQAAGIRTPPRAEKAIAITFGVGIGTLYSVTAISGPPLALFSPLSSPYKLWTHIG